MNLRLTVNSIQPADPHSIGKRLPVGFESLKANQGSKTSAKLAIG